MMALHKQPNGKYCYIKCDGVVINLTKEEYTEIRIVQTLADIEEEMKDENLCSVEYVIARTSVTDSQLKEMGYEKSREEMEKYIPMRVVKTSYAGRDCTTYGHCPRCDAPVQDGIGHTDKKCGKCSQVLSWKAY